MRLGQGQWQDERQGQGRVRVRVRVKVGKGYNVGLAEQLDAIEGLQRLTRNRGVE